MDKYVKDFFLAHIELARLLIEIPRILYIGSFKYKKSNTSNIPMDDGDLVPSPEDPYSEIYSALCAELNNIKNLYLNEGSDLPKWQKLLDSVLEEFKLYSPSAEVNKIKDFLPYIKYASGELNKSTTKTKKGMNNLYRAIRIFTAKIYDKEVRKIIYCVIAQAKNSYTQLFLVNFLDKSQEYIKKYCALPIKKIQHTLSSWTTRKNILTKKDNRGVEIGPVKDFKANFLIRHSPINK